MSQAKVYVSERDRALSSDFQAFKKWCLEIHNRVPDDNVLEISYHQLRTACDNVPMHMRTMSKRWLLSNKYRSWDDGDVPI